MQPYSFKSRISGKNATVRLYEDRLEWSRTGISAPLEILLAVLTGCLSLLVTRFLGRSSSEMIPLRMVTGVSTSSSGMMGMVELRINTANGLVVLRSTQSNVDHAKNLIQQFMLAKH